MFERRNISLKLGGGKGGGIMATVENRERSEEWRVARLSESEEEEEIDVT